MDSEEELKKQYEVFTPKSGFLSDDVLKAEETYNKTTHIPTMFNFLKQQGGLRAGRTHVLIGKTSKGKTTLVKSMIFDLLKSGMKVYLILSEQDSRDITIPINAILKATGHTEEKRKLLLDENFKIISDLDFSQYKLDPHKYLGLTRKNILDLKPQVVIFDNLTTSEVMNDRQPKEQSDFAYALKHLIRNIEFSPALIIVAHTAGTAARGKLFPELATGDIRGNKTAGNLADFSWAIEQFSRQVLDGDRPPRNFILTALRAEKNRNPQGPRESIFYLNYDATYSLYLTDFIFPEHLLYPFQGNKLSSKEDPNQWHTDILEYIKKIKEDEKSSKVKSPPPPDLNSLLL